MPYRVWTRRQLQKRFRILEQLDAKAADSVERMLRRNNCWEVLWLEGEIECESELGTHPPFCPRPSPREASSMQAMMRLVCLYIDDSPKWPFLALLRRYKLYT